MSEDYDDMSIDDVIGTSELYEMDQAAEARLDAEDDARNTELVAAEDKADDHEPRE